jgi:D-alanyl-D-alanine carboxypeptidase
VKNLTLVLALSLSLPSVALELPRSASVDPVAATRTAGFQEKAALLDAWITAQMAERGLPGMSVGLVHDGQLVWAKGYGFSDTEKKIPATPATIYRMASVTKTFTATAILQLRDAGKLTLDDPVSKYLPWFKVPSRFSDAPEITIRHLLTHTSGLPREAAFPYWTDYEFPTLEQIKATLLGQEAVFPTETRWKYSNLGFALAGEVVAAASGEPYEQYIRNHILDPLGMTSSSIVLPEAQRSRLATGYGQRQPDGNRVTRPFTDCKGITPAANLSSNVEDLARYLAFQMGDGKVAGKVILKASTLKEMHRVQWIQQDWQSGWGLGFSVTHLGGKVYVGHTGILSGYRTAISFLPDERTGVIVLSNADDGRPTFFLRQVFALLGGSIQPASAPTTAVQIDPAWARFTGRYRDVWGESDVRILDGHLVIVAPEADDPMEGMVRLIPDGKDRFRIPVPEHTSYDSIGESVSFETGPDGTVVRMKYGANYSQKVR